MLSKITTKRRQPRTPAPLPTILALRAALARRLDRLADAELRFGDHRAAEHLAFGAAELRETPR